MEHNYDVIVAGGGVAGCAAALAASRAGKKTLLIEKTLTLGGLGTIGLINLFVPMCNGRGKTIIKGMCAEFVKLSQKYGWADIPKEWQNGEPENEPTHRYSCRYSPNLFALALMEALVEGGVTMLLDSVISGCERENGGISRVYAVNKAGTEAFAAQMYIDATGDCDLAALSETPFVQGENYYTYAAFQATLESCERAVQTKRISEIYRPIHGGSATLYGANHPQGMKKYKGVTGEEVTEYVVRNQLDLLKRLKNQNPNERDIAMLPTMPQFRTTRHIRGEYTLKTSDVFRHFDDSVCLINDFDNRDNLYEVPLRCLVNKKTNNLFAVGRCASAEGYAWDVLRVIPPAILTGQAAGTAAAHAIDEGTAAADVSLPALQRALEAEGVLIHYTSEHIQATAKADRHCGAENHI